MTYLGKLTFLVRISNYSSRHEPFNIPFINMYYRLDEFNPEFEQIHFEEYRIVYN